MAKKKEKKVAKKKAPKKIAEKVQLSVITCPLCPAEYVRMKDMRVHQRSAHIVVQCSDCGKEYKNIQSHLNKTHGHRKSTAEENHDWWVQNAWIMELMLYGKKHDGLCPWITRRAKIAA